MKKWYRFVALLMLVCFCIYWLGCILFSKILTMLYADEFTDFEEINATWLYNYGDEKKIRVISYESNYAKVYFYSKTGGDYISFVKQDGRWQSEEIIANWSGIGGSADDYFVWPYYKHYVP